MKIDPELAAAVNELARKQGFTLSGFTDLEIPEPDRQNIEAFIAEERYGEMRWFPRHQNKRLNPSQLLALPESPTDETDLTARSAFVLGRIYRDQEYDRYLQTSKFRIARYAVGRDYHRVLKKRARPIAELFKERGIHSRICVDSVPLPEKILARRAGLGWQGKHTNLIHPEQGSYFLLCVILLSSEVPETIRSELPDLCRNCNLCIDACPTGALEPYRIDARKCISYITIESEGDRDSEPENRKGWVFGCDICQEVCPYNRSPRGQRVQCVDPELAPRSFIYDLLNNEVDDDLWKHTAGMALRRISREDFGTNYGFARSSGTTDGNA